MFCDVCAHEYSILGKILKHVGLEVASSQQSKQRVPEGADHTALRKGRSPFDQKSSRVSESFVSFISRTSLILSTFSEVCKW